MEFLLGLGLGGIALAAGAAVAYWQLYRPLQRENSDLRWLGGQREIDLRDERQLALDIEQWVVIEGGGNQAKVVQAVRQRIKERRQVLEQLKKGRGSL